VRSLRRWREERRARKRRKEAERLGQISPEELEALRDLQSPVKAKWGYYPKGH
jgi:hypothetical protein